jgi:hypothetical protein
MLSTLQFRLLRRDFASIGNVDGAARTVLLGGPKAFSSQEIVAAVFALDVTPWHRLRLFVAAYAGPAGAGSGNRSSSRSTCWSSHAERSANHGVTRHLVASVARDLAAEGEVLDVCARGAPISSRARCGGSATVSRAPAPLGAEQGGLDLLGHGGWPASGAARAE